MILNFIVEIEVPDEESERMSQAIWEVMPESEKTALKEQRLPDIRISEEVGEMLNRDHQLTFRRDHEFVYERVTCNFLKEFVDAYTVVYAEYGEGYFFERK